MLTRINGSYKAYQDLLHAFWILCLAHKASKRAHVMFEPKMDLECLQLQRCTLACFFPLGWIWDPQILKIASH